jgi:hypothetical protein
MKSRAARAIALMLVTLLPELSSAQQATRRNANPAAQPFNYTPEEQEACLPDAQKLCDLKQQPAVILACLRRQWGDVSEECRVVLDRHKD